MLFTDYNNHWWRLRFFHSIVLFYKDNNVSPSKLMLHCGLHHEEANSFLEMLIEEGVISKEGNFRHKLNYKSYKTLIEAHPNKELTDCLKQQQEIFQETALYLNEQFEENTAEEETTENNNAYTEYLELEQELEIARKEREAKRQQEKEKEQKKKEEKEAQRKCMFTSSRVAGQDIFVETIVIYNGIVTWSKGHLLSKKEISFSIDKVSSVEISSGLMYVDITIKSTNGKIQATNFTKGDAKEIKSLLNR